VKLSIRLTPQQLCDIEDVALFENKKPSEFVRDEIDAIIKRYERNPQFKRFKAKLQERTSGKRGE
jgi:hypothetical protein